MVNRVPKGSKKGGQFAPDLTGKTQVPTAQDLPIPATLEVSEPTESTSLFHKLGEVKERIIGLTVDEPEYLASTNKHPLKFVLMSEDNGCDDRCDEDQGHEDWRPHDSMSTYLIEGELANRIRAKLKVSQDVRVHYIEARVDTSYSEYTQDHRFEFRLEVGNFEKEFDAGSSWDGESHANGLVAFLAWLQEEELGSEASSVANALGSLDSFRQRAIEYFRGW